MKSFYILAPILYGVFTVAFMVHVFTIGYSLKHPDHPSVRTFKQDFKDLEFPIVMKICIQEMENIYDRYQNIGYKRENELFSGKSKFSDTTFGWNGHNENKTSLFSSVDGNCDVIFHHPAVKCLNVLIYL